MYQVPVWYGYICKPRLHRLKVGKRNLCLGPDCYLIKPRFTLTKRWETWLIFWPGQATFTLNQELGNVAYV